MAPHEKVPAWLEVTRKIIARTKAIAQSLPESAEAPMETVLRLAPAMTVHQGGRTHLVVEWGPEHPEALAAMARNLLEMEAGDADQELKALRDRLEEIKIDMALTR